MSTTHRWARRPARGRNGLLSRRRSRSRLQRHDTPPAPPEPPAERGAVVVTTLEFPGGAADPEDVASRNRCFHGHVREQIAMHGGGVCAETRSTSVAIFGAPLAHEDDALRAVRGGMGDYRRLAWRHGTPSGSQRGEIVVSAEMLARAVSWRPLTHADRLRTLAPGELVIDEPVRELTGQARAEPLQAAGSPAWRLIGLPAPGAAPAATRFVGRGLAVLRAAFDKTALIHPRPAPFTSGHASCIRAGHGRWRPRVNPGAHCWKATWGNPSREFESRILRQS